MPTADCTCTYPERWYAYGCPIHGRGGLAYILDCPGEGNGCRCACHGCKYHCSAHDPSWLWEDE